MTMSTDSSQLAQIGLPKVRVVFFIDNMTILSSTAPAPNVGMVWAENVNPAVSFNALMNTLGATNPTSINSIAPYNLNTHGYRFHILHDEVVDFEHENQGACFMPTGEITQKSAIVNRHFDFPKLDMDQVYFSNLSTSCMTKNVKMMCVADSIAGWNLGNGASNLDSGYLMNVGIGFSDSQE